MNLINPFLHAPQLALVNLAQQPGATFFATSVNGAGYPVASAFDGRRHTNNAWGAGGAWLSAATMSAATPEGVGCLFGQMRNISFLIAAFLANAVNYNIDPAPGDSGSPYRIVDFKIQKTLNNGGTWSDIIAVTGNALTIYEHTPALPVACDGVQILGTAFNGDFARIVEFEPLGYV